MFVVALSCSVQTLRAQDSEPQQKPELKAREVIQPMGPGYIMARIEVIDGDTIQVFDLMPAYKFRRAIDQKRYAKLINNVKKVYPIAKEAKRRLAEMEQYMLTLPSDKQQKAYVKEMEQAIKDEYTPILKKMTFSQGKVLIKLIDRETSRTSYALVKELRGGFRAFFYQGIGKIFGMNLKDTYDGAGEDKMIEHIILLYEAGLI